MAWRPLEDTFHSDRKIRKLARELAIPEPHAAGYLSTLWSWALLHAKDGDLTKFDIEDIEFGAKWDGNHGDLFNACVTSRLIDVDDSGTSRKVSLHNWLERGGSYAESQRKRLERKKKKSADCNVQDCPGPSGTIQDCPEMSALEEKRREENKDIRQTCGPDGPTVDQESFNDPTQIRDDIQETWQHYRTHHPKTTKVLKSSRKEYKLIKQRLEDFAPDDLKASIDGYHRSPFHTGQNEGGKKYLALELIMRDISHVQQGIEMLETASSNGGKPGLLLDHVLADGDIEH